MSTPVDQDPELELPYDGEELSQIMASWTGEDEQRAADA